MKSSLNALCPQYDVKGDKQELIHFILKISIFKKTSSEIIWASGKLSHISHISMLRTMSWLLQSIVHTPLLLKNKKKKGIATIEVRRANLRMNQYTVKFPS